MHVDSSGNEIASNGSMQGFDKLYMAGFEGVVCKLNVASARFANGLDETHVLSDSWKGRELIGLYSCKRFDNDIVDKRKHGIMEKMFHFNSEIERLLLSRIKEKKRKKGRNAERDVGSFEEAI